MYVRDGVAAVVARKDRIMGRLSLIKQNHVIFLAWLPNSASSILPDGTLHITPLMSHLTAPATGNSSSFLLCISSLLYHKRSVWPCLPQTVASDSFCTALVCDTN